MSKKIQVEIIGKENVSKAVKKSKTAITSLGKSAPKSIKKVKMSTEDLQQSLNRMGNRFRFMTIAFGAMAMGAIGLVKGFLDSAKEMEAATLRVGVFAVSTGQSMEKAQEIALELAQTGLVSIAEASNTLSNLLATGLNLDTAQVLMKRMLDTAVLSKESLTDTFGRAIEKSSLGIRILQERQVDAIGINFRADQVWKAYGDTIGKTTAEMTTQEKQMSIVNFLMKETERFAGGTELAMQTFGGTMSRLTTTVEIMKAKIGATLIPLFGTLADLAASVSRGISKLAEKNSALTGSLISGAVIMVTVIAGLAAVGAIIPLVISGFDVLKGGMGLMAKMGGVMMLKFLAISAVIGGLIFLVLKATGAWDKWTNSMKNLAQKIKDTINPFKEQAAAASDAAAKLAKKIAKIQDQLFLATRSFEENMAEWAKKNKDSIKEITKDIKSLETKYRDAIDKINSSFETSMKDSSISHARKTEDIKRELDEEVSKGIWADQTRIDDLKRRLKRENEDYARQSSDLNTGKDKDLKAEKDRYSERLTKLQAELDEEIRMQDKHSIELAKIVDVRILDEVEKMLRAHKERKKKLKDELEEVKSSTSEQAAAYDGVASSVDDLGNSVAGMGDIAVNSGDKAVKSFERLNEEFMIAKERMELLHTVGGQIGLFFQNLFDKMTEWTGYTFKEQITGYGELYKQTEKEIEEAGLKWTLPDFFKNIWKGLAGKNYQHGGIIPGQTSQPVPIIAHGGETVLPSGVAPITVNINNPTVRSDNDIEQIANAVKSVLSRQQTLLHYQ